MGFNAWDSASEQLGHNRRAKILRLESLIAEVLDDPLVADGAPPGLGWFERAEAALGRPTGSTFTKRSRHEGSFTKQTTQQGKELSHENKTSRERLAQILLDGWKRGETPLQIIERLLNACGSTAFLHEK